MQTFLPYLNFEQSARCLDNVRRSNQVNEAKVIIDALTVGNGWVHHPAIKMWKGYLPALVIYHNTFLKVQMEHKTDEKRELIMPPDTVFYPWWLGWEAFHACHRSNLLMKNYDFYSKYGWTDIPSVGYIWPLRDKGRYVSSFNLPFTKVA